MLEVLVPGSVPVAKCGFGGFSSVPNTKAGISAAVGVASLSSGISLDGILNSIRTSYSEDIDIDFFLDQLNQLDPRDFKEQGALKNAIEFFESMKVVQDVMVTSVLGQSLNVNWYIKDGLEKGADVSKISENLKEDLGKCSEEYFNSLKERLGIGASFSNNYLIESIVANFSFVLQKYQDSTDDRVSLHVLKQRYLDRIGTTGMLGDHEMKPLATKLGRPIVVVREESGNKIEKVYFPEGLGGPYGKEKFIVLQNIRNIHFRPFKLDPIMEVDRLDAGNYCSGSPYDGDYTGAGPNDCLLASIRAQHSNLADNKTLRQYLVDEVSCLDLNFFA